MKENNSNAGPMPAGPMPAGPMPGGGCCRVESVVSVDERGQMVLPKDIREKANIRAGDKLAVIGWESEGKLCCISLIKADQLGEMVKSLLGPMMKELST